MSIRREFGAFGKSFNKNKARWKMSEKQIPVYRDGYTRAARATQTDRDSERKSAGIFRESRTFVHSHHPQHGLFAGKKGLFVVSPLPLAF